MIVPPEVYELDAWARRLGVQFPLVDVVDLLTIDTDTLRRVGTDVWGLDSQPSQIQQTLTATSADMWDTYNRNVAHTWQDTASAAFERRLTAIRNVLTGDPYGGGVPGVAQDLPVVGGALVALADEFEIRGLEVIGWVITGLGAIVSAAGLVVAIVGFGAGGVGAIVGLVIAIIGMIVSVIGLAIAYLQTVIPRLEALVNANNAIYEIAERPGVGPVTA